MTLSQLRTLVLSWLDDPNAQYFTTAQVNVWLNNAQREVQKQLIQAGENFYVTRVSTTTVQNYDTYALPTDFMRLHKLELLTEGTTTPPTYNQVRQQITPVTLVQLDKVSMSTGKPTVHAIRKNCLILRPIPDNAYTIYMDYSPEVVDMSSDSSTPDVPLRYQEYIAVLAAFDGLLKDNRDPSTLLAKKQFYLDLMKQDSQNRNVDESRSVVATELYESGYLF